MEVDSSASELLHLVPAHLARTHDNLIGIHGLLAVNHLLGILVHFHHKDSRLEVGAILGKRHVAVVHRYGAGGWRIGVHGACDVGQLHACIGREGYGGGGELRIGWIDALAAAVIVHEVVVGT